MSFPKITIQLGPKWTGLEMTGPVPSLNTNIPPVHPKEASQVLSGASKHYKHEGYNPTIRVEARKVVADLAHYLHSLNCTTYEITLGFWVPNRRWRIKVEVCEPVSVDHPLEWRDEIREKVRSYISPFGAGAGARGYREREIKSTPFADFLDWQQVDEKWLYLTQFTVFRGVPFVEKVGGCWNAQEMWAVWGVKMAEFRAKPGVKVVPSSRFGMGRSREDWEGAYQRLLN
ncbi:hypothetical protein BJX70DRAFT_402902 [Aspergillus crustosus]